MGIQFHETRYGQRFFDQQLPMLTRAIENLAETMTRIAAQSESSGGCLLTDSERWKENILELINRQQEMIDGLIAGQETLQKVIAEKNKHIESLELELKINK